MNCCQQESCGAGLRKPRSFFDGGERERESVYVCVCVKMIGVQGDSNNNCSSELLRKYPNTKGKTKVHASFFNDEQK